jgi:hypothetical protein
MSHTALDYSIGGHPFLCVYIGPGDYFRGRMEGRVFDRGAVRDPCATWFMVATVYSVENYHPLGTTTTPLVGHDERPSSDPPMIVEPKGIMARCS